MTDIFYCDIDPKSFTSKHITANVGQTNGKTTFIVELWSIGRMIKKQAKKKKHFAEAEKLPIISSRAFQRKVLLKSFILVL